MWAIAIAWPFFQNVTSGPEALTHVGADRLDLLLLIVVVVFIPPTVLLVVELVLSMLLWRPLREMFHAGVFGLMVAVIVWQQLLKAGHSEIFLTATLILVAGIAGCLYLRTELVRSFASFLAVATPVVIAAFLFSYPVASEALPHKATPDVSQIASDTPVVMVVLDEMPLVSITEDSGRIDQKLFPNFARLADTSTWYRNAVTSGETTLSVLPTLLTGNLHPVEDQPDPPSSATTPDNLCSIFKKGGYETHSREAITDYCETHYGRRTRFSTLFGQGVATKFFPGDIPQRLSQRLAARTAPVTDWGFRNVPLADFINGMPSEAHTFSFIHSTLPHFEWHFMPNGQTYHVPTDQGYSFVNGERWSPIREQLDTNWQRLLLQVGYVDREIGRLMKQMKQSGAWDSALVVVVADHGIHLEPDSVRRDMTSESVGDTASVPLFVKYPGQNRGRISDQFARSADVAPTILDALDIDLPGERDGRSLLDPEPDTPPTLSIATDEGDLSVAPREILRKREDAQRSRDRLFASGTFYAIGGHADLLGKQASGHSVLDAIPYTLPYPEKLATLSGPPGLNGGGFEADLDATPHSKKPRIAVALDGVIVATTKAWEDPVSGSWRTAVILPPAKEQRTDPVVELYEIVD